MIKNGIPRQVATQSIEDIATIDERVFFGLPLGAFIIFIIILPVNIYIDARMELCQGRFDYNFLATLLLLFVTCGFIGSALFVKCPRPLRIKKHYFIYYFYRRYLTLGSHKIIRKVNEHVAKDADFETYFTVFTKLQTELYFRVGFILAACTLCCWLVIPTECI